jgi:N-acetylmuramoyl-L-alanine amidase
MRNIDYIIIHCSATRRGQDFKLKDIDAWHEKRGFHSSFYRGGKWQTMHCGYHYVIDIDGTVEQGRPEDVSGAHCKGYNDRSIGICYIGGVNRHGTHMDTRTIEQVRAMYLLLRQLHQRYPQAKIVGHHDLNARKACPCFQPQKEYASIMARI